MSPSGSPQNQFVYHDGSFGANEAVTAHAGAVAASATERLPGAQGPAPEDPRCNGTLRKQASPRPAEGAAVQRYSADPTVFLGERGPRAAGDEDGYMTPEQDKTSGRCH